jgi:predicted nuclease of predicted toxin-antitoxin system
MASFKFLLDNDVRHLASQFPPKQTCQLEDVGLAPSATDEAVVMAASVNGHIIVTNNRRDFEHKVQSRIEESSKKEGRCGQVHGLIVVLPSERLKQEQAVARAGKSLRFEGKRIGWKDVTERCL